MVKIASGECTVRGAAIFTLTDSSKTSLDVAAWSATLLGVRRRRRDGIAKATLLDAQLEERTRAAMLEEILPEPK